MSNKRSKRYNEDDVPKIGQNKTGRKVSREDLRLIRKIVLREQGKLCADIGREIGVSELVVFSAMRILRKGTCNVEPIPTDFIKGRVIILTNNNPTLTIDKGSYECGLHPTTWRRFVKTLSEEGLLNKDYVRRKNPGATSPDGIKNNQALRNLHDLKQSNPEQEERTRSAVMQRITSMLEKGEFQKEGLTELSDIISPGDIMNDLWLQLIESIAGNTMKPGNFTEGRQLLELQLRYMEAEEERNRRREEKDPFRPYKDMELNEIFTYLFDAIEIAKYLNQTNKQQELNIIREECMQLLPEQGLIETQEEKLNV